MKCEYCGQEIPSGGEVESNGHYFCNQLHRYYWEQRSLGNINYETNDTGGELGENKINIPKLGSGMVFDNTRGMSLGDIFSNSISLIKETFTRNLIILLSFLVPTGILMAIGLKYFFSFITTSTSFNPAMDAEQIDPSQLLGTMIGMVVFVLSIFVFVLGYLGAEIGVLNNGCNQIEGRKIPINETISKIFSFTYLKVAAQIILKVLAFSGIIAAGILSIFILKIFVYLKVFNETAVNVLGFFLVLAAVIFVIYLTYKWYFIEVIMVHTDCKIIDSFKKSSFLVKNYWWRTIGIMILISIAVNFAVSIISTPVSFIFMWGYYAHLFKIIASGGNGISPADTAEFLSKLGTSIGYIIVLNIILESLATPLFVIVMYFDLKIKKHNSSGGVQMAEAETEK